MINIVESLKREKFRLLSFSYFYRAQRPNLFSISNSLKDYPTQNISFCLSLNIPFSLCFSSLIVFLEILMIMKFSGSYPENHDTGLIVNHPKIF